MIEPSSESVQREPAVASAPRKPMTGKTAKELLKGFCPDPKYRGKVFFVDTKLRVFPPHKWSRLFKSNRKGFLVQVQGKGKFEPLNLYQDPKSRIQPRTFARWCRSEWEIKREIQKRRKEERNARAIRPEAVVRTRLRGAPKRILVIDIETTWGKLEEPPAAERIQLVGVKEFRRCPGGYQPMRYEPFDGPAAWNALRARLQEPVDLILGYNLFGFDYYFLESIVPIESISGNTVDLFLWLCSCLGFHRGLRLTDLCRINLGIWKSRFGKPLRELDRKQLHRYNERDLDLTFRLWLHAANQKLIQTSGTGAWKAGKHDLQFLFGRRPVIDHETWLEKRRDWKLNQPSPIHQEAVNRRLGSHDTEKITWPSYTVVICSKCSQGTVFQVSESYCRRTDDESGVPEHFGVKNESKSYRLRCACGQSIRARSLAVPRRIGSFAIARPPKRYDDYWSPRGNIGARSLLSPFGETWERLFRKFKLGRIRSSSTTFTRKPTRAEAARLSAAVGEECRRGLTFNEHGSLYLLIDRGSPDDISLSEYLSCGMDGVLENYWKAEVSWISRAGLANEICCQTCGAGLTIHDIPLVHPAFQTPICQTCVRLGRHRYSHRGRWQPRLKRWRSRYHSELLPTISSREESAYYLRRNRTKPGR